MWDICRKSVNFGRANLAFKDAHDKWKLQEINENYEGLAVIIIFVSRIRKANMVTGCLCVLFLAGLLAYLIGLMYDEGGEPDFGVRFIISLVILLVIVTFIGYRTEKKQKKEKEKNNSEGENPEGITDTSYEELPSSVLSYNPISREYYDLCIDQVNSIMNFLDELNDDCEFIEIVKSAGGLDDIDKAGVFNEKYNRRLCMLYFLDFAVCFRKLGNQTMDDPRKSLPMMLLLGAMIPDKVTFAFEDVNTIYPKALPNYAGIYDIILPIAIFNNNEEAQSYIDTLLQAYDSDRAQKFKVLLYRFSSLVAKSDGTINPTEAQFLASLLAITERGEEEKEKSAEKGMTKAIGENDPMAKLQSLIGLQRVKEEVKKLADFIKIQQLRQQSGLKTSAISYHCVFTGNPGTGKTTVARIIAEIYKDLGILAKGHLVETDRSGLVAEYVGQTAVKTNKIIDSALDGVLFIDEAYSLVAGSGNDYGLEAIATLLKRMEDDRDRLIVILAGYGDEMKTFIDANPGLQSRFNRYIHFNDYSAEELLEIYIQNVSKHDYLLAPEAEEKVREMIREAVENKDHNFGNARFVRNLFEKTLENQASRLAPESSITKELLQEIRAEDIVKA